MLARDTTPEVIGHAVADERIVLYELTPQRSNLEDVFLGLTAEGVVQP